MSGVIYLIGKNEELEEMKQRPYESEETLQKYLAKYPHLLAGDQMNPSEPRRWLLVKREMEVPGEEAGAGRWAVDHLFLDQDGIPTLVETKRSTDTRSRREVVAQMMDYAANAVVYWSLDKIQAALEVTCRDQERDAIQAVMDLLLTEDEISVEKYWETVKTNLEAKKIRLVFMADQIQPELKRIVEFLNKQMSPAEVLAIQVPQFVGQNQKALVPIVLGQTEKSVPKPPRETKDWDENSFFQFAQGLGSDVAETSKRIYDWALERHLSIVWGKGTGGAFGICYPLGGADGVRIIGLEVSPQYKGGGRVYFLVGRIREVSPFSDKSIMREAIKRLDQIPNVYIKEDVVDDPIPRSPGIQITYLREETAMKKFLEIMDWIVEEIRGA